MVITTLTFHRAVNYGAALQSFALYEYLRQSFPNDNVGVLDYVNPTFRKRYEPHIDFKDIKRTIFLVLTYRNRRLKANKFKAFLEKNVRLVSFTDRNFIDLCFVGSDQVWNAEIVGYDSTFLLDFLSDDKKCSYAASIGSLEITEKEKEWLKGIENFAHISVREPSGAQIVESLTGSKPTVVPDPVFLLQRSKWESIETPVNGISERFVLIYKFGKDSRLIEKAISYSKENDCEVVILNDSYKNNIGMVNLKTASPDEFLWLIEHSICVFTNSFHATALSIIFNRSFYSDLNTPRNTRIIELLDCFDLGSRSIRDYNEALSTIPIDWDSVGIKMKNYRKDGQYFIKEALSL